MCIKTSSAKTFFAVSYYTYTNSFHRLPSRCGLWFLFCNLSVYPVSLIMAKMYWIVADLLIKMFLQHAFTVNSNCLRIFWAAKYVYIWLYGTVDLWLWIYTESWSPQYQLYKCLYNSKINLTLERKWGWIFLLLFSPSESHFSGNFPGPPFSYNNKGWNNRKFVLMKLAPFPTPLQAAKGRASTCHREWRKTKRAEREVPSKLLISSGDINFVIVAANFCDHLPGLFHQIWKNFKNKLVFK